MPPCINTLTGILPLRAEPCVCVQSHAGDRHASVAVIPCIPWSCSDTRIEACP